MFSKQTVLEGLWDFARNHWVSSFVLVLVGFVNRIGIALAVTHEILWRLAIQPLSLLIMTFLPSSFEHLLFWIIRLVHSIHRLLLLAQLHL